MYLRTPKRYQGGQRRSIISLRWLWLWILTPIIVYGGLQLYENREAYIPQVESIMTNLVDQAQSSVATVMAPTPLPTEIPTTRLASADAAWVRGALEEAVATYQEVAEAVPNDVGVHYRLTLGLLMDGQFEQALEAAERAVTADPYDPNAWAIRAMALDWNQRYGEAVASAQRALDLAGQDNPEARARALAFMAEAYYDLEQYDRALSSANQALEINPDSYEALRSRALVIQNTQFDFAAAMSDLQAAYDIAPNMPYVAVDLALIHARDGNADSAMALLTEILDLNPQNTTALYWMGWIYLNSIGDPNQSADYLTRCVQANPQSINCHYLLGRAQMRTEQYATAAESFKTALDLGSTSPLHYWWAGRAQVVLGNCPAATPFYQTGYQLAQQSGNESLIADYEAEMRSCGLLAPLEPTAEATEEATDGDV
ncbi:MAG TPA: tetratricopeptide repeat protein [Spirillospora sp.]|nr:tetratricopeptide repeat protein [Spirillospora sp.]